LGEDAVPGPESRGERPLSVSVAATLLVLAAIGALAFGIGLAATGVYDALEQERQQQAQPPSDRENVAHKFLIDVSVGAGMVVLAVAFGWVGIATARGFVWAWTTVAVAAVLSALLGTLASVALLILALTEPIDRPATILIAIAWACLGAAGFAALAAFRRRPVRAFFGRATDP